jgi:hypothetical protein
MKGGNLPVLDFLDLGKTSGSPMKMVRVHPELPDGR